MKPNTVQPIQIISPEMPIIPNIEVPQVLSDPTNPLAWILLLTLLLSNTDEVINAIANLIRAVTFLKRGNRRRGNGRRRSRDT